MITITTLKGNGTLPEFIGRQKVSFDAIVAMLKTIEAGISASGVANINSKNQNAELLNTLSKFVSSGYSLVSEETLSVLEGIAEKFKITEAGRTEDYIQYIQSLSTALDEALTISQSKMSELSAQTAELESNLQKQKDLTKKILAESDLNVAKANERVVLLEKEAVEKEMQRQAAIVSHNNLVYSEIAKIEDALAETNLQITNAQAILDSLSTVVEGLPSSTLWPPDYPDCIPAFDDCCGCAPLENGLPLMDAHRSYYYIGVVNGVKYAYPKVLYHSKNGEYYEGNMINSKEQAFQLFITPYVTQQQKYAKHRADLLNEIWPSDYQP